MKIAGQFPAPLPRQLGRSYSENPNSLDVHATAIAAAERGGASIVGIAHRVAHHSAHATVHLKTGNLIPQGLDFIGLNKCACAFALRMDCVHNVTGVLVHLCGQVSGSQTVIAAALCKLGGQVATLGGNGIIKSKSAIADAVTDVVQPFVQLAELLAKQDFLLRSSSRILAELALAITQEAATHKDKEEQDNDPPCPAVTPTIVAAVNSSAKIRQAVIVQKNHSFRFILCQQPPVHRKPLTLLQKLHELLCLFLQTLKLLV